MGDLDLTPEQIEMLVEARQRSEKLLSELIKAQADVSTNPPDLEPKALSEGKQAMDNAVASARRALQAIDDAMRIALPRSD